MIKLTDYTYDSMKKIKEARYDGRKERLTYDEVGNISIKTTNDITEKYIYNVKNQLKELHTSSGINYFTLDEQGNTIKEETKTGNNIFEYNTLNQQVKAITKEGNTLVSRYDTEGLRAEIEENEKLTKFIFHKENVLVEADKDFKVVSRFVRGYEVVAADISDVESNSEIKSDFSRYYYAHDEQGSTIFITDKNQQVKNEYYYDAFGNVLEAQEQVHNRITYTGQQFDGVTGQYYLRARFYNSVIGRFTQEDIYRCDGLNLYAYCGNNPVRYYDPSGYNTNACKGKGETQANSNNEHHELYGEHSRNGEVLFDDHFISGNEGRPGKLNQQEALLTHTERKFLNAVEDDLEPGDILKMEGTLPPCRPGCQPAIRTTVADKQVNVNYKASANGYEYKWTPVDETNAPLMNGNKTLNGSVIQQVYDSNGKQISSHRYWKSDNGKWKRAKY